MARLELEAKGDFHSIRKLAEFFPELRAMTLGFVGKTGVKRLRRRFLLGQEITLRKYPFDAIGRRTIKYSVGKGAAHVRIGSYPLNLFESGRRLRSGRKEPGKRIIKGKFKKMMEADLQGILNTFDNLFLKRELKKFER